MELVASSKMRRAKERVEHSRPYFETLHETLTQIAAVSYTHLAIGNFAGICLVCQQVIDEQDEKRRKAV